VASYDKIRNLLIITSDKKAVKNLAFQLGRKKYNVFICSADLKEIEQTIKENSVEIILILTNIKIQKRKRICKFLYTKFKNKMYITWMTKEICTIDKCELLAQNLCKNSFLWYSVKKQKDYESLINRIKILVSRTLERSILEIHNEVRDVLRKTSAKGLFYTRQLKEGKVYSDIQSIEFYEKLLKEAFDRILKKIKTRFTADRVSLFSYSDRIKNYQLISSYGLKVYEHPTVVTRQTILINYALQKKKPLLIQNGVIYYPEFEKLKVKPQPKIISSMVIPVIVSQRIIGILNIARMFPKKEKFTMLDFELAQVYAERIGLLQSLFSSVFGFLEYEKLKHDLVAIINHEMRTPIMAISAALELASKEMSDQLYEILERNVKRLYDIVDNLIKFSDISKGTYTIEKKEASLQELIEKIKETYDETLKNNGFDFTIEQKIKNDKVYIDEQKVLQVLNGLISNSIKFSKSEGEKYIKLYVEEKDDEYLFCVEDNGIGIDKNNLERIFFPFVQIGDVLTEHKQGLGINLYISRYIIEQHGGRIWAESEKGKYTKMFFTIPKK
jgi:signal transduction histidine kinase